MLAEAMAAGAVETVVMASTSMAGMATTTRAATAMTADTYDNQLIAAAEEMAEAVTATTMATETAIN